MWQISSLEVEKPREGLDLRSFYSYAVNQFLFLIKSSTFLYKLFNKDINEYTWNIELFYRLDMFSQNGSGHNYRIPNEPWSLMIFIWGCGLHEQALR